MKYPLRKSTKWDGEWLARHLNASLRPEARKRVLRLIECFRELQRVQATLHPYQWGGTKWCYWLEDKRVAPLWKEANRLLARYRFYWQVPVMFALNNETPPLQVEAQRVRHPARPTKPVGVNLQKLQTSETTAVAKILRLAEWDALGLLRQCPDCRDWYLAHREDQTYCSLACNKRAYKRRNSEKNREAVRRHRQRKKDEKKKLGKITVYKKEGGGYHDERQRP